MSLRRSSLTARAGTPSEAGGAMAGFLVAVVLIAALAVGAFYYFGGRADVKIKKPDISVTSSETPN